MQLLKKRTFNDYFGDTFGFIKENGGHFFKNYFILSSVPIGLMVIIYYYYFMTFMNSNTLNYAISHVMGQYVSNNLPLSILIGAFIFIIMMIFGIIQYAYTPVYLKLYLEKGTDFDFKDIFNKIIKEKIGKILKFFLFSVLISIPVFFITGLASLVLLLTIVGWIIPFIVVALWYSLALFACLADDKSVLESFRYAWKLIFKNFWRNIGAVSIFTIIIIFIVFGISMVMNMVLGIASFSTGVNDGGTIIMIFMLITTAITQILQIAMQMVMQIMNGIIYYSSVEETENFSGLEEIEKIGLGE